MFFSFFDLVSLLLSYYIDGKIKV